MNPLPHFLDLFATNHFTTYFILSLAVISLLKYVKPKLVIPKRLLLWAIIVAGLLLRIGWLNVSSYEPKISWDKTHMLESDVTNVNAIELTRGIWFHGIDGQPSGRRPIGYPMLLGLMYRIFGIHHQVIWALNLMLFAATVVLIFLMAKILFSERVALLAAFLFSVYPVSIYSVKLVTDEHLFLPLWYLGLYLLLREINGKRLGWAVVWYGIIFGYATMTRTNSIFMPFVIAFAYFLMKAPWKRIAIVFVGVFLVMQLINLPWVIRNYKVWGVPVLYTATSQYVYTYANLNATAEGGHIPRRGEPGFSEALEKARLSGNEGLYHAAANRELSHWLLTHPGEFLLTGTGKLLIFMGWNRSGGVWPIWFQYYEGSFDPSRPLAPALKDFFEETAYTFYYCIFFSFLFSIARLGWGWKKISEAKRAGLWVLGSCFFFWFPGTHAPLSSQEGPFSP